MANTVTYNSGFQITTAAGAYVGSPYSSLAAAGAALAAMAPGNYAIIPVTTSAVVAPSTALAININASGQFVNGAGTPINVRGVNVGASGYTNGGTNLWGGMWPSTIDMTTLATFKANVVRLTLSQASILGQNTLALSSLLPAGTPGSWATGKENLYPLPATLPSTAAFVSGDADGQFTAKLKAAVDMFTAAGYYVILDLHFTAPDVVINGVTYHVHNNGSSAQQVMPDSVNGPAAIAKLATQYASYSNVMIECYNEPGSGPGINWAGWKNGAAQTKICVQDWVGGGNVGTYYDFTYSWQSAGMQALVTAARTNTGFKGPLIVGGIEYGSELGNNGFADTSSTWLLSKPTDPLNKLVASLHCYSGSTYGAADYAEHYASDQLPTGPNGYREWIPFVKAINAAGYPCIIGEFAGDSSTTDQIEPFVSDCCAQVDAINATKPGSLGALMWLYGNYGGNAPIAINATTGAATVSGRTGHVVFNWMSNHA